MIYATVNISGNNIIKIKKREKNFDYVDVSFIKTFKDFQIILDDLYYLKILIILI